MIGRLELRAHLSHDRLDPLRVVALGQTFSNLVRQRRSRQSLRGGLVRLPDQRVHVLGLAAAIDAQLHQRLALGRRHGLCLELRRQAELAISTRAVASFTRLPSLARRGTHDHTVLRSEPIVHEVVRQRRRDPLRAVDDVHEEMFARRQRHDNGPRAARAVARQRMRRRSTTG